MGEPWLKELGRFAKIPIAISGFYRKYILKDFALLSV
jgi:hypothetical protein